MASDIQYVSLKKLNSPAVLMQAAKHNLREYAAELVEGSHIDASKTTSNVVLAGTDTARGVVEMHRDTVLAAGSTKKLRKDAVLMVECVVSLPEQSTIEPILFFRECLQWVRDYFGCPVVSAVVHLDEAAPHCHYLIVPLVEGVMRGSGLVGGKAKLRQFQLDFNQAIGSRYGLRHNSTKKLPCKRVRDDAANRAVDALLADPSLWRLPNVRYALHSIIATNPVSVCDALGLPLVVTKPTNLVSLMTKPVNKR